MPLKPEIIQVLERMKVSRIEAAHDASGSAIAKLTTDYARRNVLGSGFAKTAMDEAKLAAFGEAAKGVYVDYLAVAGDARLNDEELRELQTLYGLWLTEFVEGLNRNGLRPDLVDRFLMPARREADIAFGRELLRRQSSSRPKPEVKPGDIRDYFISHAGPDREGFVGSVRNFVCEAG